MSRTCLTYPLCVLALLLGGETEAIADAPLTYYQTVKNRIYSRQIYGINADFGVSAKF